MCALFLSGLISMGEGYMRAAQRCVPSGSGRMTRAVLLAVGRQKLFFQHVCFGCVCPRSLPRGQRTAEIKSTACGPPLHRQPPDPDLRECLSVDKWDLIRRPPCSQQLPAGSSSFLCRLTTRQCNSRSASSPFNNWWQLMRRWWAGVSLPLHHLSPLNMKMI